MKAKDFKLSIPKAIKVTVSVTDASTNIAVGNEGEVIDYSSIITYNEVIDTPIVTTASSVPTASVGSTSSTTSTPIAPSSEPITTISPVESVPIGTSSPSTSSTPSSTTSPTPVAVTTAPTIVPQTDSSVGIMDTSPPKPPKSEWDPYMPGGQVLWPPATLIDNADGTKTDPKFNSTWIVLPQNLRHIYSQLQAFSFDEKYLLLQDVSKDGAVDVYLNAPGFPIVHDLKSAYAPVWSPTSNVIYYLRGSPGRVFKFDVATGQETLLVSYPDIPSFSEARSWEDMDRNGRFKAIVSTSVAKVLVFDVINKTTIFNKTFVELGTSSINWVAVSPSGKYLCIQHDADDANNNAVGRGVDIWNLLTGKFHRNLHGHHNHGDWGIDDLGDYYFSVQESPGHPLNSNKPCLKKYYVEEDRAVTGRLVEWYTHLHFSAKGPKGFPVCISAQPNKDSGKPDHPLMGEIYLHFDNGDVRRLCHHRSGNSPYEAQPHASISPTGKSVIFATNFFGLIRSVIVKTGIV